MIKPKSLTQVLLSAFVIRLLVTGASIGDSLAVLSLSAIYAFYLYLESKKEPVANKDLSDRIALVEEKIQKTDTKVGALALRR